MTMLSESTSETDFGDFMAALFKEIAPGNHFILGIGDNAPTDTVFERLLKIRDWVERHGRLPISI